MAPPPSFHSPLPPGAVIGILGNGQLGRMLALAAARFGYRTHVYGPEADSPAEQVATESTVAAYDDTSALEAFARSVSVVTFEFENVPAATAAFLAERLVVRPSWRALEIAQDRIKEKTFFNAINAGTAPWKAVSSLAALRAALAEIPPPAVLKTTRLGYDGKGQAKILSADGADAAWAAIGGTSARPYADGGAYAVLEGFVDFSAEISVIAARGADGQVVCFEPAENVHKDHILSTSSVPARISPVTAGIAVNIATRAAQELDLVGLLAVEMFVSGHSRLLCNEMAPRPHNSGHWTMDACGTDQFAQMVRAIAGLPLVDPGRHADVTMVNLIGNAADDLGRFLTDPSAHPHLYGKREARPGRKMGHVNILRPKT